MGMFSQRTADANYQIMANESYQGSIGAYRAMTEGFQNSYAVFESCIGLDFMEAAVVNESTDAAEFEVVQEGFAMDFFTKIKDFLTKLIEKIKGIVKSFITKITGTFTKDGKALVNKYKADVLKKDLSKMKYKWMKDTSNNPDIDSIKNIEGAYRDIIGKITLDDVKGYIKKTDNGGAIGTRKIDEMKDRINDNEYLELDLGILCGQSSCELSEFAKEFHDYLFDEEEECEGFGSDGASLTEIMTILSTGSKVISELEKEQRNSEKKCKERIKEVEKAQKELRSIIPTKDDKVKDPDKRNNNVTVVNTKLNLAMTLANQLSTVTTKYFACLIDEEKKYLARCKKVFVQAASYRPKSTNEDAILIAALGEAAEYEVCEMFDAIGC